MTSKHLRSFLDCLLPETIGSITIRNPCTMHIYRVASLLLAGFSENIASVKMPDTAVSKHIVNTFSGKV